MTDETGAAPAVPDADELDEFRAWKAHQGALADAGPAGEAAGLLMPWHDQPAPPPDPGAAAAAEALANAYVPHVGEMVAYASHDAYADPPRTRVQLVYVTGIASNGEVHGKPMGFADDGAVFQRGQLQKLG